MTSTYRWVPPARYDWIRMVSGWSPDAPGWRIRREQLDDELAELHNELWLLAHGGAAAISALREVAES